MPTLTSGTIARLSARLRGEALTPEDPRYDSAREIWNKLYDGRPALVVRCRGHADIANAVRFARENDLEVAVKGGGHHVAGHASTEGGLLLDLSPMRGIQVNPSSLVATAQGGSTWADFDCETQEFGLACTGPIVSMTGLPGFLLGGGFGWLQRKLGLGCDHIVAADLVNADGQHMRASIHEDPELLWGLRGAGWNFGVVSSMDVKLGSVGPEVLAGVVYFPIEQFADLCQFHQATIADAEPELTTWLLLRLGPAIAEIPESLHRQPVCAIAFCHCGEKAQAEAWAQRIRAGVKGRFADSIQWRLYRDWQRALDSRWGNGFYNDWRSHYFDALEPECVEVLVKYLMRVDSPFTDIKIPHLGGAVAEEPDGGTSFAYRNRRYCVVIQARWNDPAESENNLRWAKELHNDLKPFSSEGAYVNFLGRDEDSRIPSAYGAEGYRRLRELKKRVDPNNVFRLNANILWDPLESTCRHASLSIL